MSETPQDSPEPNTTSMNIALDVRKRLTQLAEWQRDYEQEDAVLSLRIDQLDPENRPLDEERGAQLISLLKRARLKLVREPFEIPGDVIREASYKTLHQQLINQYAGLSKRERLMWLNNLLFIVTPELRELGRKIDKVRGYRSFGQQRNFLLGGVSGMGKSTFLDWYAVNHPPTVEATRNHVPILKIDAPVTNRTPKPLLQRMILACGKSCKRSYNEENLLNLISIYFHQCRVEVVVVDEVEHIVRDYLRRRLLEVSNLTLGVTYICASCNPVGWVEGDEEVRGRWNDAFVLNQYTGEKLDNLLSFVELLLPLTRPSSLSVREIITESGEAGSPGPAKLIEQMTGGVLREVMILLADASKRAIEGNMPNLTPPLLEETWKDIQTNRVTDFLKVLEVRHSRGF